MDSASDNDGMVEYLTTMLLVCFIVSLIGFLMFTILLIIFVI